MWKCLHTKPILPQAVLVYIKCSVSPHWYYSKVAKETGELDTVIVELPTKGKTPRLNYIKCKSRDPTAPGKDKEVLENQPDLKLL